MADLLKCVPELKRQPQDPDSKKNEPGAPAPEPAPFVPPILLQTLSAVLCSSAVFHVNRIQRESPGHPPLKDASEAALKAAENDFQVSLRHLPGAGGNWAKFASGVDPKAAIREALTSPNALPTQWNGPKLIQGC